MLYMYINVAPLGLAGPCVTHFARSVGEEALTSENCFAAVQELTQTFAFSGLRSMLRRSVSGARSNSETRLRARLP